MRLVNFFLEERYIFEYTSLGIVILRGQGIKLSSEEIEGNIRKM